MDFSSLNNDCHCGHFMKPNIWLQVAQGIHSGDATFKGPKFND